MNTIDPFYSGRPYGGTALIYKERQVLSYEQLECESDRIVGIKVCSANDIIQICALYLYAFLLWSA